MKPITTEAAEKQPDGETDKILLLHLLMEEHLKKSCLWQVFFSFLQIYFIYIILTKIALPQGSPEHRHSGRPGERRPGDPVEAVVEGREPVQGWGTGHLYNIIKKLYLFIN